ncbi:DNL zinc finger-domain-containing protein [Xylaria castorea]|nr:DNL zinc finger-domain-containing protein [Xylaria castorea]
MVSRITSSYLASILRTPPTISPPLLRPHRRLPRTLQPVGYRFAHAIPKPTRPDQGASPSSPDAAKTRKQLQPHYRLRFTCVPCGDRSSHAVSKQGYHHGSVLITCPKCRNRHIISDHLNIFGDRKITVEDLLREKGQLVKRGTLGEEGDIEFWEDTPTDSADAGRADVASLGEGAEDEARKLREARDPSSQATDPTPSASVLAGDAGTRPSVQGVSQQSPTPSTRRQYHAKSFMPPRWLMKHSALPLDQTKSSSGSEVHTSLLSDLTNSFKFEPSGWLQRSNMTPIGQTKSSSGSEVHTSLLSDLTKSFKFEPPRRLQKSNTTTRGQTESSSGSEVYTSLLSDLAKLFESELPRWLQRSNTTPRGQTESSSGSEVHTSLLFDLTEPSTFKPPSWLLQRSDTTPIGQIESSFNSDYLSKDLIRWVRVASRNDTEYIDSDAASKSKFQEALLSWLSKAIQGMEEEVKRQDESQKAHQSFIAQAKGNQQHPVFF